MYRVTASQQGARLLRQLPRNPSRRWFHTTPIVTASSSSSAAVGSANASTDTSTTNNNNNDDNGSHHRTHRQADAEDPHNGEAPLQHYSETLCALLSKSYNKDSHNPTILKEVTAMPDSKNGSTSPKEMDLVVAGYRTNSDTGGTDTSKHYQVLDEEQFQAILNQALRPLPPSATADKEEKKHIPTERIVPAMPEAAQHQWRTVARLVERLTAKPIAACEKQNRKRTGFLRRPPAPMTSLFFFPTTTTTTSTVDETKAAEGKKVKKGESENKEEIEGRIVTSTERRLRLARAATAAELAALLPRKLKIDHRVRSYYYPFLKYSFLALSVIQFAVYFNWIFIVFDWNLMEPTTYFLGYTAVFLSLVYHYVRCGNEDFTWKNLFLYMSERKKLEWYKEKKVDAVRVEQLEARLRRIDAALEELETYE